jgi:hypothetical protein
MQFTYSIYDGNPNQSGQCVWPAHDNEPMEALDIATAVKTVERIARKEGRECGEYEDGTTIWYLIWDEDEIIVGDGNVTL